MANTTPLSSQEVRWFFDGRADEHKALKCWFETTAPIPKSPAVSRPEWKCRLDDQPDVYLLVPGSDDMGIKWREGTLQIKGRVACQGTRLFCGRHRGVVEQWMKWSYSNPPASYRRLFMSKKEMGLFRVAVRKTRALRMVRLDTLSGKAQEVGLKTFIERGLEFELTELDVAGKTYCSLAFEAFPGGSPINPAFADAIETFLDGLTALDLTADNSQSYPAFLCRLLANRVAQ
jgi:hypothetical protein